MEEVVVLDLIVDGCIVFGVSCGLFEMVLCGYEIFGFYDEEDFECGSVFVCEKFDLFLCVIDGEGFVFGDLCMVGVGWYLVIEL